MDINKLVKAAQTRNALLVDDVTNKVLNRAYYQFKYLPLEGALRGLYFQQQTEDAINDIGNIAYATEVVAAESLKIAQQAYNTAISAIEIANNALAAGQTAQQTANTALNTANNAQSAADTAQQSANTAQIAADAARAAAAAAQETANNATSAVNTAVETANNAFTTAVNAQQLANQAITAITAMEPIVDELNHYDNVTDSVDLNTQIEFARTYIENPTNTNAPEAGALWLDVDDDFNDTYIRQKALAQVSGKTYVRFGTIVPDSDPIEVSSWTAWVEYAIKSDIDTTTTDLTAKITAVVSDLDAHEADYNNPHKVTAAQLGLSTAYKFKGSVVNYSDLPTTGQEEGDTWNIETADPEHDIKAGDNVAWDGTAWDKLGGNHDFSEILAQIAAAQTAADAAQKTADAAQTGAAAAQTTADNALPKSGGTMTGLLTLSGDPTSDLDAATKGYVDAAVGGGGGGDVTAAGDNNFTGTNIFNKPITVRDAPIAGIGGKITLGTKPNSLTTQAAIHSTPRGAMYYTATETNGHFFMTGTDETAHFGSDGTTATFALLSSQILNYSPTGGLEISAGVAEKITFTDNIYINSEAPNPSVLFMSHTSEGSTYTGQIKYDGEYVILDDVAGLMVADGSGTVASIGGNTDDATATMDMLSTQILNYSPTQGLKINAGTAQGEWNIQLPNNNGDAQIRTRLYVGSSDQAGAGVISGDNSEQCLYFTGTAENTYYSVPSANATIKYQPSANCYLINCATNNPATLTLDLSTLNFKATVGSVPHMCKTLTFWVSVGATVPVITWTFPTTSTVYYPGGSAPTLTANANNIINVIAIVDDTGSYYVQVCDVVALPTA